MLYLLSETNVFISLPNGCLCQMTGEPVVGLVPKIRNSSSASRSLQKKSTGEKRPCPWVSGRPTKRQKSTGLVSASQGKQIFKWEVRLSLSIRSSCIHRCRTPVEIHVARTRLFYGRPQHLPKSNKFVVGLPVKRASILWALISRVPDARQISWIAFTLHIYGHQRLTRISMSILIPRSSCNMLAISRNMYFLDSMVCIIPSPLRI